MTTTTKRRSSSDWADIIRMAEAIVRSYTTTQVTLRQLFYRLVAAGVIENKQGDYKALSHHTARARREAGFPALMDRTREIAGGAGGASRGIADFLHRLETGYRLDHTRGQETCLVLGAEKATLQAQLEDWFGDLHVPVVVLRGYSSQTYTDDVAEMVQQDGRKAVLLYVGDFDASGEDIDRDFVDRTDCWDEVVRVAVRPEHVGAYGLVEYAGKARDSRAAGFVARHGKLVQVEAEALDPTDLEALMRAEVARWWDEDAYAEVLRQQADGREKLRRFFGTYEAWERDDE